MASPSSPTNNSPPKFNNLASFDKAIDNLQISTSKGRYFIIKNDQGQTYFMTMKEIIDELKNFQVDPKNIGTCKALVQKIKQVDIDANEKLKHSTILDKISVNVRRIFGGTWSFDDSVHSKRLDMLSNFYDAIPTIRHENKSNAQAFNQARSKIYQAAMVENMPSAQYELAMTIFPEGIINSEESQPLFFNLLEKAATHGDSRAAYQLGKIIIDRSMDENEKISELEKNAPQSKQDQIFTQIKKFTPKKEASSTHFDDGLAWLTKAAQLGHSDAKLKIGLINYQLSWSSKLDSSQKQMAMSMAWNNLYEIYKLPNKEQIFRETENGFQALNVLIYLSKYRANSTEQNIGKEAEELLYNLNKENPPSI
jgi:TPR repeat protein